MDYTKSLQEKKTAARDAYKAARCNYMNEQTEENWRAFCIAKRTCRLLGVTI